MKVTRAHPYGTDFGKMKVDHQPLLLTELDGVLQPTLLLPFE